MTETSTTSSPGRDWASLIVTFLLLSWILIVTFLLQVGAAAVAKFPDQILLRPDVKAPAIFFLFGLVQCIALLLPLLPLALFWRAPRYRAAFRAWLAAALFLLLLAPARLIPSTYPQLALLLQFTLALLFSFGLWLLTGRSRVLEGASQSAIAIAVALGIVFALPWLLWGALGSPVDALLDILGALAIAFAVTLIITRVWLRGISQDSRGAGWDTTLGGFVVGAQLLIIASAIGFLGAQLLFMIALLGFGWLLMDLAQINTREPRGRNTLALLVFMTLIISAPLLFLDPNAGVLQASPGEGEVWDYAQKAAVLVFVGSWLLGLLFSFLRKPLSALRSPLPLWASAVVLGIIAVIMNLTLGQPGFFGDRVFVIFKDQADVSAAAQIANYGERRAFVFNTLTRHANQTQSDLRRTLDLFGIHYTPYYLVNALEVDADFPLQWWLASRADVARVLPAPVLRPLPQNPNAERGTETSPPPEPEWNLTLIGADQVWQELGVRGAGVLVGQSDSGVDGTHPELAVQYRGRAGSNDYNWLDLWNHTASPIDADGHGTHTLGSILGKTVGVAPGAEWIACVNLARNLANPGFYLGCMQFNFAPYPQNGDALRDGDPQRGAMVLNNSWGCPDVEGCDPNALLPAVRALRDAGVFVVASAGNEGPPCSSIAEPIALYDDVFSVGAIDRNRHLADFSSRGPVTVDESGRVKPDISAPGVNVLSSLPGGTYGTNSGTSMAGPHIVGVVALMWSANPKLIGNIDKTEQILRETAQPANIAGERIVCGDPSATPNDLAGYGIVDAYAAVKRALEEK